MLWFLDKQVIGFAAGTTSLFIHYFFKQFFKAKQDLFSLRIPFQYWKESNNFGKIFFLHVQLILMNNYLTINFKGFQLNSNSALLIIAGI